MINYNNYCANPFPWLYGYDTVSSINTASTNDGSFGFTLQHGNAEARNVLVSYFKQQLENGKTSDEIQSELKTCSDLAEIAIAQESAWQKEHEETVVENLIKAKERLKSISDFLYAREVIVPLEDITCGYHRAISVYMKHAYFEPDKTPYVKIILEIDYDGVLHVSFCKKRLNNINIYDWLNMEMFSALKTSSSAGTIISSQIKDCANGCFKNIDFGQLFKDYSKTSIETIDELAACLSEFDKLTEFLVSLADAIKDCVSKLLVRREMMDNFYKQFLIEANKYNEYADVNLSVLKNKITILTETVSSNVSEEIHDRR